VQVRNLFLLLRNAKLQGLYAVAPYRDLFHYSRVVALHIHMHSERRLVDVQGQGRGSTPGFVISGGLFSRRFDN
jgi:hypothetical protein